jgi:hypothetical protein
MKKFLIAVTAAAGLAFAASPALAVAITPSPTISSAGNTFDTFTCSLLALGSTVSPTACGQINVSTTGGDLAIQSGFVAGPGSFDDALLGYHVHSTAGINSIDLSFNGTFLGLAVSAVTETVRTGPGLFAPIVGQLTVTCSQVNVTLQGQCDLSDPPLELGDIQLHNTYTDLWITKDILLLGVNGLATISIIGQSFHQVPEPASLALFGSALIALGALRRRRRKNTV